MKPRKLSSGMGTCSKQGSFTKEEDVSVDLVGPGPSKHVFKGRSLKVDHQKLASFLNFQTQLVASKGKQKTQEVQREKEVSPPERKVKKRFSLVFYFCSLILTYSAALAFAIRKDEGLILGLKASTLLVALVVRAGSAYF